MIYEIIVLNKDEIKKINELLKVEEDIKRVIKSDIDDIDVIIKKDGNLFVDSFYDYDIYEYLKFVLSDMYKKFDYFFEIRRLDDDISLSIEDRYDDFESIEMKIEKLKNNN